MAIEFYKDKIVDGAIRLLMASVVGVLGYWLVESQRRAGRRCEKRLDALEYKAGRIAGTLRTSRGVITYNEYGSGVRRGVPVNSPVLENILRDPELRRQIRGL